MELQTEFPCPFTRRIIHFDNLVAVEEGDQVIVQSDGGQNIPAQVVSDLFGELFVPIEHDRDVLRLLLFRRSFGNPAAPRGVARRSGGVPDMRFGGIPGDFVLITAKQPRGLDLFGAEIESAVPAVDHVVDFRDEVVVIVAGNDQTIPLFVAGVMTPEAFMPVLFGETPAARDIFVGIDQFPLAVVVFDEERLPFTGAEVFYTDVPPADFPLISGVNLESEEARHVHVVERVGDFVAVEPGPDRGADALDFDRVPVVRLIRSVGGGAFFGIDVIEPDDPVLVAAASFVVDAAGVGGSFGGSDLTLIAEHVGARTVPFAVAAELDSRVTGNQNFVFALENEVAEFFFGAHERVAFRFRIALADDHSVFNLVEGIAPLLDPAGQIFTVEKGDESFFVFLGGQERCSRRSH